MRAVSTSPPREARGWRMMVFAMSRDLTIRGARLVLPDRVVTGDLAIEAGVITALGPSVAPVGREIDGTGRVLLPGVVDACVRPEGGSETVDSFTRAAAAGGVTAVLALPGPRADRSPQALEARRERTERLSVVGWGLLCPVSAADDVARHCAGVLVGVDELEILESLFDRYAGRVLLRRAPDDVPLVREAIALAARHGRRLHAVVGAGDLALAPHLVAVTTPEHLVRDGVLDALRDGTLAGVVSHHDPLGRPGVEWLLPQLLDRVSRGELTLAEVAAWLADSPARAWGLRRKGRLEVGFDGDVVLVDPSVARTVSSWTTWTAAASCPLAGETLTGWPVLTVVSGRVVFEEGRVTPGAPGRPITTG